MENASRLSPWTDDALEAAPNLRHGFFTREGGVSEGRYGALNCGLGSADDPDRVRRNRALATAALGLDPDALVTVRQVHSARVVRVTAPDAGSSRPEADALVTDRRGIALGVLAADCAPVLLGDFEAGVIGAAHAGWRGAKDGVLAATVAAMAALGARPAAIVAAVGPCIRQPSYEVGLDFRDAFVADDAAAAAHFAPGRTAGKAQFDLAGFVASRLRAAGVGAVAISPHDTFADEARFFSYRRVTLDGGGDYGRMISAIALV